MLYLASVSTRLAGLTMQYLGSTTIAPGEDGYAFQFSRTEAAAFLSRRQENQWGEQSWGGR